MKLDIQFIVIVALVVVSALALFLPVSPWLTSHWQNHLWDLGHTLLFFSWSLFALKKLNQSGYSHTASALMSLLMALVVGALIELIQMSLSRDAAFYDLVLDLAGTVIAITIWHACLKYRRKPSVSYFLWVLSLVVLVWVCQPLATSLYDGFIARKSFPILISGQSSLELDRLYGKPLRHYSKAMSGIGITFTTDRYSLVYLSEFPRDWSGYQSLHLTLYQPDTEPLPVILSIEDAAHRSRGTRYHDRYNLELLLPQGSAQLNIPLSDIQNAARNRRMDISQISRINLYTMDLPRKRTLYLTEMYLTP